MPTRTTAKDGTPNCVRRKRFPCEESEADHGYPTSDGG